MIGARIADGLLTTAVAAMVVGCAPAAEPQADTASAYPSENLAPFFQQVLPNVRGKTVTSAIVTFPPAARAVPHRHGDAFVYAYVLEGAVTSQLEGEPAHVYHQGENWSGQPGAHHRPPRTPARPNRRSCWSSSSPPPENSSRSMIRTGKLPHCRTADRCLREHVPRASALRRRCVVAGLPVRRPAAARRNAPVQIDATRRAPAAGTRAASSGLWA